MVGDHMGILGAVVFEPLPPSLFAVSPAVGEGGCGRQPADFFFLLTFHLRSGATVFAPSPRRPAAVSGAVGPSGRGFFVDQGTKGSAANSPKTALLVKAESRRLRCALSELTSGLRSE